MQEAIERLAHAPGVRLVKVSAVTETKPVGPIRDQPDFLNAVAAVRTALGPLDLLNRLLAIEESMGRVRKERWGPRRIDLDLLLYGNRVIDHRRLRVPHPELWSRPFVLEGLSQVGGLKQFYG